VYCFLTLNNPSQRLWGRERTFLRFAAARAPQAEIVSGAEPAPVVGFDVNLLRNGEGSSPVVMEDGSPGKHKVSWMLKREGPAATLEIAFPLEALAVKPAPDNYTLVRLNYVLVSIDTTGTYQDSWTPWGDDLAHRPAAMGSIIMGP